MEKNSKKREFLSDFYGMYPLSKTLRFSLIPIGKTQEFITREQFIEIDEDRSLAYQKAKTIIDRYHKIFINEVLGGFSFGSLLDEYLEIYSTDDEKRKEKLERLNDKMRKMVAQAFKVDKRFTYMFKAELFSNLLPTMDLSEDEKIVLKKFDRFTTYFLGFYQNRQNMYLAEPKSTSIAHRIVDINLVKYVENFLIVRDEVLARLPHENLEQLSDEFNKQLNGLSVEQFFSISHFNHTLCQVDIDTYNSVIGGIVDDDGNHIKGINQYINLYNQVHDKFERIPLLKPLYKQILSDHEGFSFIPDQFKKANEVTSSIKKAYQTIKQEVLPGLEQLLNNITRYNLNGIFIKNDTDLSLVSQRHFGSFDAICAQMKNKYRIENPMRKGGNVENYEKQVEKFAKGIDSFSLLQINDLIGATAHVESYFQTLGAINNEIRQQEDLFALIANRYHHITDVIVDSEINDDKLRKRTEDIKNFLDAIMQLKWFVKPLNGCGNETGRDLIFYGEFTPLYEKLDEIITPLYSKVRNYLTRKPFSTEKFKLNFNCPTLLNGWDVNKESANLSIILKRDNDYFLGIFNHLQRKALEIIEQSTDVENGYDKMYYKLLANPMRDIPHVAFADRNKERFNYNDEIDRIKSEKSFKTGEKFNKQDLYSLIDFFKNVIKSNQDWSVFEFAFSDTSSYNNINDFYQEIKDKSYRLDFKKVPVSLIEKLVDEGALYLFQIYNKDFSKYSKGRPNLHTIYWNMLFDKRNLENVVYKLNGQAEIFFRHHTKGDFVTHKANKPIENKSEFNKLHKQTSTFEYDIVKDRRYSIDHYEFHVPITMNFKVNDLVNINTEVKQFIKQNGIRHIIGIDRGERHLLYLTMINLNGDIVKQFSLNHIASNPNAPEFTQNYHSILDKKEGDRLHARQNWSTINQIKDLKGGYLSQVVHVIAKMMIENDAIVVLENLNTGFMRGRQKVEKSVYQKFEKALIDKLNYIVDKGQAADQPGGALKAIQLTGFYDQFCRTQKGNVRQSGFVFYIPAWNTSKIDPVTGFTNMFDLRLTSMEAIKSFFSKMDSIRFDAENDCFTFSFDYDDFTTRSRETRSKWIITTLGERIYTHRSKDNNNNFVDDRIYVSSEMKALFIDNGAQLNGNLKEFIARSDSREFLFELLHLFKLTMQMRNSVSGTDIDYIISPAIDKNGHQYDSRNNIPTLPENADANGAYNIARKGLMIVRQIQECDNVEQMKYDITNKKWLIFAQQ